jgi:NitT/TauT family transport system substrate-binding protein
MMRIAGTAGRRSWPLLALVVVLVTGRIAVAQTTVPVIHVGSAGKEADAEVYYALDEGFFTQAGLDVDVQTLANGAAIASGVASGALDIGDSNVLSLAVARERGLPFVLLAPGAVYAHANPTTQFVVAPSSAYKTARDLDGATVAGVSLGGLDQISMEAWIEQNGGDPATVKFVELPPGQMVPSLQRGNVAAASLADPFLTAALGENAVRVLGNNYDAVAGDFAITAWFSTSDWAKTHPDLVRKFADVMAQTADWANANHAAAAAILFKYTKGDVGKSRVRFGRRLDPALIQPVLDAGYRYKALKRAARAGEMV